MITDFAFILFIIINEQQKHLYQIIKNILSLNEETLLTERGKNIQIENKNMIKHIGGVMDNKKSTNIKNIGRSKQSIYIKKL